MRLNNDIKNMGGLYIAILTLISSIITVFTVSFNKNGIVIGIAILIAIFSALFIYRYIMPKGNMPDDMGEILEEDETTDRKRVKLVFPCDERFYHAANELAKEKFGKNSVSTKTVNDWKKRNELNLTCLTDKNKMVGYFDILPLKTEFAKRLINGDVGEKDIRAEDVLGVHEMKEARYLYFAGIAVKDPSSFRGMVHASSLVCAAIMYVRLFYENSEVKKILTIPTSECGLRMTEHLEFSLEREAQLRKKDNLDLYSQEFDISKLNDLMARHKKHYNHFNYNAYIKVAKKISGLEPHLQMLNS